MLRKNCLILNFTANSYHWGCFGTSIEIYDTLVERGYYVNYLPVEQTHTPLPELPQQIPDFDSSEVAKRFTAANMPIVRAITQADLVLCNGEGTLHEHALGPWQLLYLMYFAKKYANKTVALINHSAYPSGSLEPSEKVDQFYGEILKHLDLVASREVHSTQVLKRLGINAVQSFDCLPLFIARNGYDRTVSPDGPIILSGGVSLNNALAGELAAALHPLVDGDRKAVYLAGAKSSPAPEDLKHFEQMKSEIPKLELLNAQDIDTWIDVIGSASLLVSARFHHTIAAASLQTPLVCLPSNTPKIEGICSMLGLEPPISPTEADWQSKVQAASERALRDTAPVVREEILQSILKLGKANFLNL
ncbi:Polysaccharide pyruvyl transferase family protein WcaK [Cohaesibacter marisflavi]|uniref:Polysaccharide pyruvyl transferase family protein WcaK n=1 Tax=Cohaesibacter marisflavi TaxID=655353 RepID=A0A1I5J0W6_9HYPH|nr:polysaccharide pyruvyl transferase family protein [Cohaesibacter marisflavi]SFO66273.1 Polysaccharide pyruvyl transferase family protein WcaK [Cohaesibacter marisflavi]